jgi:hypothetical protein
MRQILRLIGNRYGAATVIVLVVVAVLVVGKIAGVVGNGSDLGGGQDPGTSITTGSPEPDDGMAGNEGSEPASPEPPPSPSAGAAGADVVATNFAKAWLHHSGVSAADWHKAVAPYTTKTLADRLDGVDPGSVPANQVTGAATVTATLPTYLEMAVPTDAGTLILHMVVLGGHWLVDTIDWQPK